MDCSLERRNFFDARAQTIKEGVPGIVPLTQDTLRELLEYCPDTGLFTWRYRDRRWFNSDRHHNAWNARFFGRSAGSLNPSGYIYIHVFMRSYKAHRLAFLYMTGEFPPHDTDHINHNKADNRWVNIRAATRSENCQNKDIQANNTSGTIGVSWHKLKDKWESNIKLHGRVFYLGTFNKKKDAITARKVAEIKYGFHPNHGSAAP